MTWRDRAACRGSDSNLFFPEVGQSRGHAAAAKAICATCPVTVECRTYAIENRERFGIWGGMATRKIRRMANA